MRRYLQGKLILSYLAVALLTVLVVSVTVSLTSGRSLLSLVLDQQTALLTENVQTYYAAHQSLSGFADYYFTSAGQPPAPPQTGGAPGGKPPDQHLPRGLYGLVDAQNRALLPMQNYAIGQTVPAELTRAAVPVTADGQTIAYILPDTSLQFSLSPQEKLFQQRVNVALGLAALAGVLAAVAIGSFLAGRLLQPIRRLTQASQALARGDLNQQVPVTSLDELGQLTATFNQMSADLAQADEQRKRLTADITHDLSTPLHIVSGYVEMLEAGQVALTPQRVDIIKTELNHLRRLVGDLTTLSQAEAGRLEMQLLPARPADLLRRVWHTYQPLAAQHGVTMQLAAADDLPRIVVDEGRLEQVLKNLVDNALRYTPSGGTIELSAVAGAQVHLRVRDTGAGIEAEDLPLVFDRFYRADKARNANAGKMGLGLAICKALVAAQGGQIRAESGGPGQGTTMIITFEPAPG